MSNYGNSFGPKAYPKVGAERINVWDRTIEFYPSGAVLKVSDTYKEGAVIPAGTPVSVDVPGGEATLNSAAPVGLTYQDVVMGSEAASLTIVTRGTILESRVETTYTSAQKTALKGSIIFVKEV
jgi:hypothetical protein